MVIPHVYTEILTSEAGHFNESLKYMPALAYVWQVKLLFIGKGKCVKITMNKAIGFNNGYII